MTIHRRRSAILLCATLALSGCAVPTAAERAALNALVGASETDLLRSRGVPTRSFGDAGHLFLAYDRSETLYDPGFGFGPFGGGFGYGGFGYGGFGYGGFGYGGSGGFGGFGGGYGGSVDTYSCSTTFEIVSGRVVGWTLHGDGC